MLCIKKILAYVTIFFFATTLYAADAPPRKLVFVHDIKQGSLQKSENHYVLTAYNTQYVVAFSAEQDYKYAANMSTKEYAALLKKAFTATQEGKNAALIFIKPVRFHPHHVEIKKIIVNIKNVRYLSQGHKIMYDLNIIKRNGASASLDHVKFSNGVLFVDSVCASCGGEGF